MVGPEGGFNAQERELMRAAGAAMWRLGGRVMRAETASIAGLKRRTMHAFIRGELT